MSKKSKDRNRKRKKNPARTAGTSDPWALYELSVQEPEAECDLIEQVWREIRGSKPRTIREDFCGTALNCIEWVSRNEKNKAVGIDIAPDVLERARNRIETRLTPEQSERVELIEGDVTAAKTELVDSVLAFNFSYYLFKTRASLQGYFKQAYRCLQPGGLFLLDAYGGSDSFLEMEEPRKVDGFTYIWEQAHYNPITGDVINHIHFRFPDGTKIRHAFTYEWRLWTLPEIQEVLLEAGFSNVSVYWEGSDEDGDGNGEWAISRIGEAAAGWIAYLVAEK